MNLLKKIISGNNGIRIDIHEIAASVADFGTILPILFAAALMAKLNLPVILVLLGAWYALTGLYYRIPVPVEPMKAAGAIIIAQGTSDGELAAAGITLGVIFLVLGLSRRMNAFQSLIPLPVIRGIQLGLDLLLLKASLGFIKADPVFAFLGVAIIIVFYFLNRYRGVPDLSALCIIASGIGWSIYSAGVPSMTLPVIDFPHIVFPGDFLSSGWNLVLPQIPLTIANAILATSLMAKELYGREVEADRLSITIGLMNITTAPLGGFPLCHGTGGMAAHYRFGGRTGGTNIVAACILFGFALFISNPAVLAVLPQGMFGALLIFVALELGRHGIRTTSPFLSGAMALAALFFDMTVAFIGGLAVVWVMGRLGKPVR